MQSPAARSIFYNPPHLSAILILAVAGLGPLAATAGPITLPTGLNPGDQYRLAFVTSTTRDAISIYLEDYDAFVTNAADAVPELLALGTGWTAIASNYYVAARDHTLTNPDANGTGFPIYLLNDTKLADDNADLWDGTIDVPLSIDESGNAVLSPIDIVWTGSIEDGDIGCFLDGYGFCALGTPVPRYGRATQSNYGWVSQNWSDDASQLFRLYAVSAPFTYVPEPGTASLLALGVIALGVARRRF